MKKTQVGFTLIETIIAIAILGLTLSFIIPAIVSNLRINNRSETRSYAIIASQRILEVLRAVNPQNLPVTGTGTAINVILGGKTYVATPTYCSISTYCTTTSRYVQVKVTLDTELLYTVETVFSRITL